MDRLTKIVIGYAALLFLMAAVSSFGYPQQTDTVPEIAEVDTITEVQEPEFVMFTSKIPTVYEYLTICELYGVTDPEIVFAQSCLESGHFRSEQFQNKNNHLGIRVDGKYKYFTHWSECLKAYKEKVQNKKRIGEDHYTFLRRIGYAEDPNYINKVKRQVRSNRKRYGKDFEKFYSER